MPTSSGGVQLHEEASAQSDAAFDWYLERSTDAAFKFYVKVDCGLAQIVQAPQRWQVPPFGTRRDLAYTISLHADLPRTSVRRDSDWSRCPHQPQTGELETAALTLQIADLGFLS